MKFPKVYQPARLAYLFIQFSTIAGIKIKRVKKCVAMKDKSFYPFKLACFYLFAVDLLLFYVKQFISKYPFDAFEKSV